MPITERQVPSEVLCFLARHHITAHDRVAVAFSGGSDSLGLLLALCEVFDSSSLVPLYVNHRLRAISELHSEIELNRNNCAKLGLDLTVLELGENQVEDLAHKRGAGIEDAARILRYQALEQACIEQNCTYLATAHNADDQIETVLKRVFQGSSISTLEGIRAIQKGFSSSTTIVRPTLACTHASLREYVQEEGFVWSEDSTNAHERFERNAIRKQLMPAILTLYPQAHAGVTRLTSRAQEVATLLEAMTQQALQKVSFGKESILALDDFLSFDPAIRDAVLLQMFNHLEQTRVSYARLAEVRLALEESNGTTKWTMTSGQTTASLDSGMFLVQRLAIPFSFCRSLATIEDTSTLCLGGGIVFSRLDNSDDPFLLSIAPQFFEHAVLRSPCEGDRIELEGKTVLLSKLFSEWKLSSEEQKQVPVLEDTTGIVAVFARFVGGRDRLCARAKTPLVGRRTNIYSVSKRNECSET